MGSARLQAIWVIARRDFVAVVFSRAFIFFLLGPLFPIIIGFFAGAVGASVQHDLDKAVIGVAMPAQQGERLVAARNAMIDHMAGNVPDMQVIADIAPGSAFDPRAVLKKRQMSAVVTGTLDAPVITGTQGKVDDWSGMIAMFAGRARSDHPDQYPEIRADVVATSAAHEHSGQVVTAQAGQLLLFLLTMLLAGMVLSNLVEEKANKIIEVLAASIPLDALFMGKLFAMLGVSMVGVMVWGSGYGMMVLAGARHIPLLATPAVGWPLFLALGFAYFAMAYLLLGSMFLTIGGMANTVREVQTLSMPATMMQLVVFFLASFALARPNTWIEKLAEVFPISSPYAMLAHAAEHPSLMPHVLALGWQALCVAVMVRGGAAIFRRNVMKSGGGKKAKRAKLAEAAA
ncbi:ABC transporter permease [Novosphingobium sp.]|uniref:ABC transporter permease n=1 Tax=Novosphingobium sp. TaxID=1874826 RepID=UPI003B52932D